MAMSHPHGGPSRSSKGHGGAALIIYVHVCVSPADQSALRIFPYVYLPVPETLDVALREGPGTKSECMMEWGKERERDRKMKIERKGAGKRGRK